MQVSKRLVVRKEIPVDNSKDLISSMDVAMAEYYCKNNNYERGLEIFREAIPEIIDEAEADLRDLLHIPDNYKVLFLQTCFYL